MLLGSVMMFPSVCKLAAGLLPKASGMLPKSFHKFAVGNRMCAIVLLTADTVLFPSFFLSDGLMQGIMQQHVFPHGWFLSTNNVTMLQVLLLDGIGRFLGPPLGRWHVVHGGQQEYASQQLAQCIGGAIITEVVISQMLDFSIRGR